MDPLEQASKFQLDVSESSWYDLWHTHVDLEGKGNRSRELRARYLEALFCMFERAIFQTRNWEKPSNVWLLFVPEESEDDSLYVHTPNPNRNSSFPYPFDGVQWGVEPPEEIKPFLKESYEIGVSDYNGKMFWIRERITT